MIDEDTELLLTLLFLALCAVWLFSIIPFNLPKVIGSLMHWPLLGKFPLNIGSFYVLLCIGWGLLIVGFHAIFRFLDKRARENLQRREINGCENCF